MKDFTVRNPLIERRSDGVIDTPNTEFSQDEESGNRLAAALKTIQTKREITQSEAVTKKVKRPGKNKGKGVLAQISQAVPVKLPVRTNNLSPDDFVRPGDWKGKQEWIEAVGASNQKPAAKVVANNLARRMNSTTGRIDPTIELIALNTDLSEKTVKNSVHSLEADGWIKIKDISKPKSKKSRYGYQLISRNVDVVLERMEIMEDMLKSHNRAKRELWSQRFEARNNPENEEIEDWL